MPNNEPLEIHASESSSKHDFDFYVGKWIIHNRRLNSRLSGCDEWTEFEAEQEMRLILHGMGNIDNFIATFDGEPFEGMSLRLFDPATRLWSMYWTDTSTGVLQPPTVGSFDGAIGKFYTRDTFDGRDIIVEFQWDKTDVDRPIWSQAFSADEGETWETNWYMHSRRAE